MSRWELVRGSGVELHQRLRVLLTEAGVQTVEVRKFVRPPSFRGSSISPAASELTYAARQNYNHFKFGFWDFVLSGAPEVDAATRRGVFAGAVEHQGDVEPPELLAVDDFIDSLRSGRYVDLLPRHVVALNSRVVLADGRRANLPMLDFSVGSSSDMDELVTELLDALGLRGDVFDSGKSYHFIGHTALFGDELSQFLGRAALLSPLIDGRWTAHQLVRGYCTLRVSTDSERHPHPTVLVATTLP